MPFLHRIERIFYVEYKGFTVGAKDFFLYMGPKGFSYIG